jgi:asparagine synthase (glutamine-hydrolysing)
MNTSQAHRGPDDEGVFMSSGGKVALANRRLAIIDLSPAGHQPMQDPYNRNWITFNGEIYNYQTIRADLVQENYPFRSSSDTEVILALYAKYGLQCLEQLRGMFAFGLWDEPSRRLLLARDPLGIKPLYYYKTKDLFLFSSEIRALLASGLVPKRLNLDGLASYLHYGSVEAPWTIIEGVRSMLPGHYMIVDFWKDMLRAEEVSYTDNMFGVSTSSKIPNRTESVDSLQRILEESVRLHLVSDVPVGVFLSGGIDSSALVALMTRIAGEKPKTFSVVFTEGEFSEASHSRSIAKRFNTDHTEILLDEERLLRILPDALKAMDQPTMDGINTFVISKVVKESGTKVALSGLGGDELFAGYPSFKRAKILKKLARIPHCLRHIASIAGKACFNSSITQRKLWKLLDSDCSPQAVYTTSRELFNDDEIQISLENKPPNSPTKEYETYDPINAVTRFEIQGYMANTLLRDTDFMSMANALEIRVPFVDQRVIQFVLELPGEWKIDPSRPKPLLLDALDGALPKEIWQRRKMGFTLPFEKWMLSRLKPEIEETLCDDQALSRLGVNFEFARMLWQNFKKNPQRERWSRPWALYVLEKWCDLNNVKP